MSKYEVGGKIVLTINDVNEKGYYPYYVFNNDNLTLWKQSIDKYAEPLSTYTLPLEAKIRRQAEEITRLLAEIVKLKEDFKDIEPLEAKIKRQAKEITRLLIENKELKEENKKLFYKVDSYELYGDQHEEEYNQAFNQGAEAAWELVRKIGSMPCDAAEEIFGIDFIFDLVRNDTYQEAAAKVVEWEKAKEEIKVGDVYMSRVDNYFVIYDIDHEKGIAKILWGDLSNSEKELDNIKKYYIKTSRHIDIDNFLKQIKGTE